MVSTWNKEFVTEFIELYRGQECLWKVKSKDYNNRRKKKEAYSILIDKLREVYTGADRETVVRKINAIRTQYRKELRKVKSSKVPGCGNESVYTPTLWYFQNLHFLQDQEMASGSVSVSQVPGDEDGNAVSDSVAIEYDTPFSTLEETQSKPTYLQLSKTASFTSQLQNRDLRKRSKCWAAPEEDEILVTAHDRHNQVPAEDQHDFFGKIVAHKLRQMPREQRIHAEKFISDILYEGELGTLSRSACPSSNTRISDGIYHSMPSLSCTEEVKLEEDG